ncbi:MAG: HEAT repeat domain-containing protein [Planctomycetes bacterium]|nr:HEAT repeat domain-containing protein [Planctomycetota bacterium]
MTMLLLLVLAAAPSEREMRTLAARLSHAEFRERDEATRELIAIGEPALPILAGLCEDAETEAGWRARSIFLGVRGYPFPAQTRLDAIIEEVAGGPVRDPQALAAEIVEIGEGAVEHVAKALERMGPRGKAFRARILARFAVRAVQEGPPARRDAARSALARAGTLGIPALREAARDPGVPEGSRLFALEGIARIATGQAAEVACDLLADPAPALRRASEALIAESGDARHWRAIAGGLAARPGDWKDGVRDLVASVAARIGEDRIVESLRDHDPNVRVLSAWACALLEENEPPPSLRSALADEDPRVRAEAAEALATFARAEDVEPLAERLRGEEDPGVRRVLLESLARLPGDAAPRWIAVALRDPSLWVRRRAVRLLGRRGQTSLLAVLVATARDPDPIAAREAMVSVRAIAKGDAPEPPGLDADPDAVKKAAAALLVWWSRNEAEISGKGEERGPASQAGESARVLSEMGKLIAENFYSVGREEKLDPAKLVDPARGAMAKAGAACAVEKARPFLTQVLEKGAFYDLDDLGRFPASLPLTWGTQDWTAILNAGARALAAGVGDPFTRLIISHDPEGRLTKEVIPVLFGGAQSNGLILRKEKDRVAVDFVLYDSPAYWAGIAWGDRVIFLDGKAPGDRDEVELNRRVNEKLELTIFREGWRRPQRFALEPAAVFEREPARGEVLPGGIGYLRLQYFGFDAAAKFEWTLRKIDAAKPKALIIDLRGNPGGLVAAAVEIADKFLPAGEKITTLWNRDGKQEEFLATDSEADRTYPLVVLIDRSSASAAEMLSGAWRDDDRATLVGDRTYGKGVGQQGFAVSGLPGKSILGTAAPLYILTLTTVRYTLPSGASPHGTGVAPHLELISPIPSGERHERVLSVTRAKGFAPFVEGLLKEHGDLVKTLARFDGGDPARWPGLAEFAASIDPAVPAADVRDAVRAAVRARLACDDPQAVLVDFDDDPALRAAVRQAARKADIDISEIIEYGGKPKAPPEPPRDADPKAL